MNRILLCLIVGFNSDVVKSFPALFLLDLEHNLYDNGDDDDSHNPPHCLPLGIEIHHPLQYSFEGGVGNKVGGQDTPAISTHFHLRQV